MNSLRTWHRSLILAVAAYAVATVFAVMAILVVTGDPETIAAGFLVPVFVLPSIILYVVFAKLAPDKSYMLFAYFIPAGFILAFLFAFLAMDQARNIREGSGIAAIALVTYGSSALAGYLFLLWWEK